VSSFLNLRFVACLATFCVWASPVRADPLDPWVWRNPLPSGNNITGIAYGNGTFAAVDDSGLIITSQDSTNWSAQTVGGGQAVLTGVVYAQNLFVAVGSDNTSATSQHSGIFTSPDGTNWTSQFIGGSLLLSGINYGSNEFVAVGIIGAMFTSPDGTNWSPVIAGTMEDLWSVAYGTNGYVVVGSDGTLVTSPDGNSWTLTQIPTNVISGQNLTAIVFATNKYVAVGQYGAVLTSPDGITWTNHANPASMNGNNLDGICYGDGIFVAVGGTTQTSPDGIHWTTRDNVSAYNLTSIIYANSLFVAAGGDGTIVTSPYAVGWTRRAAFGNTDNLLAVTFGKNEFVAVGGDLNPTTQYYGAYTIWTSLDGVNWTRRATIADIWLDGVAYGSNVFVAVGYNGLILSSFDGFTWATRRAESGSYDNLAAVTYGSNLFVTVGGQEGSVLTSPDGITWTARNSQTQTGLNGVAYGNNEFVAVGYNGTVVTSPDGTNWTSQTPETTSTLAAIAYGNGVFVAAGVFNTVITSTDGIHWNMTPYHIRDYLNYARSVTFANGVFVTAGDGGAIQTSPDGYTWSGPSFVTDQNLYAVCGGFNGFSAVSDGGGILQSDDSVVPPKLGTGVLSPNAPPQYTVTSAAGQSYMIQASTDLSNWVTVTNVTLKSTTGQFIDPSATNYSQRFYRAAGQ
jgi:hypothetical protein